MQLAPGYLISFLLNKFPLNGHHTITWSGINQTALVLGVRNANGGAIKCIIGSTNESLEE